MKTHEDLQLDELVAAHVSAPEASTSLEGFSAAGLSVSKVTFGKSPIWFDPVLFPLSCFPRTDVETL